VCLIINVHYTKNEELINMAKHKKLTFLGAITVFSMFFSVATVPMFFIYDYGWVIYIYPIYFFTLIFF